ncbi:hypothetical protein [Brevibacillus formosus]|uniref:hypothetical protein n=1 Tax=Brevibacillus formosus TaxID=54913 RepID=UPI003F1C517A
MINDFYDRTNDEKTQLLLQHEAHILQGILESKAQYRKVVKAAIAQWVKDLQAGTIKIKTVDDFEKLVKLDLALQRDDC